MKFAVCIFSLVFLLGCSTKYPSKNITGQAFPSVNGNSLSDENITMPQAFSGKPTLLLIGYKQDSQFDIDRWLIGLDMKGFSADIYEIPTISGLMPRMIRSTIDNGMKKGIPSSLWANVITVYQDAEQIQRLTGNTNPNNARVILLDQQGVIRYFYDQGFSVAALNALLTETQNLAKKQG